MVSRSPGGDRAGRGRDRPDRLRRPAGPLPSGLGDAGRPGRGGGRPRGHPGLEHPGPRRGLVRRHGHGRGVPHAESAPDRRAPGRDDRPVPGARPDRLRRPGAAGRPDPGARSGDRAPADHRRRRRRGPARPGRPDGAAAGPGDGRGGLGRLRRDRALRPVLHLGHDRRPQGRNLHPPVQLLAHPAGAAGRRDGDLRRGHRPGGGADVPRQRLGPAVRGPGGRRRGWSCPDARPTAPAWPG